MWNRGLPLLVNLDRVYKKDEAVDCWPQSDVLESRLHLKGDAATLADLTHILLENLPFFLVHHFAELAQLRLHKCRQPSRDSVDG